MLRRLLAQVLLHPLPEFTLENRLVLPGMAFLLMANLTDVDRIRKEFVERAARKAPSARLDACA